MEDTQKQSRFNDAVGQSSRINQILAKAHLCQSAGNLFKWNVELDKLWKELAPDAKPEDYKIFYGYIRKYVGAKRNPRILYQVLMGKEIFLRRVLNKQGKGTAYSDPLEDDF